MRTLHVRNVPESLYERLRQQAQIQNRSISAEVIVLLDRALTEAQDSQAELLENIRLHRFFNSKKKKGPDSTTLLREDRDR
jgi:plasmid stability protein